MKEQKIYYRESRWWYLALLFIMIITYIFKNLEIMSALAVLLSIPIIAMNELKPKKQPHKEGEGGFEE